MVLKHPKKTKTKVTATVDRKAAAGGRKDPRQTKESRRQQQLQEAAEEKPEDLGHTEREMMAIQIRNLEEKVQRRDVKLERLQRSCEAYKERWEQEAADKTDTVEYLKRALKERAVDLADLQERLLGFQQATERDKQAWDEQHATLQALFNDTKDKLTEENMRLVGKLSSLEEFRIQKEAIESDMAKLKADYQTLQENQVKELQDKDLEVTMEKERLKREVVERIESLSAEFRRSTSDQMSFTIRKTILENAELSAKAEKDATRMEKLVQDNRTLSSQLRKLTNKSGVLSDTVAVLTRKCSAMQMILGLVKEQAKNAKTQLEESETVRHKTQEYSQRILTLENKVSELRLRSESLEMEKMELEMKVEEYRATASQHQRSADELGNLLLISARTIRKDIDEENDGGDTVKALLGLLMQADNGTTV